MTAGRQVNTKSTDWCTPLKYIEPIKFFFGGTISLDPCSNEYSLVNAKTELFENGLEYIWIKHPTIYVNPPYGRNGKTSIYDWLKKCDEARQMSEVIALIPVATNTKHWKEFVFQADIVCFLGDTRLKFFINGNIENKGASMACCLVYWGKRVDDFISIFSDYGNCCIPLNQNKSRKI